MNKFDEFSIRLCINNNIITNYFIFTSFFKNTKVQNEVISYIYNNFDFSKFKDKEFNGEISKDFFDGIKKIILHTKQKMLNNIIFL